MARFGFLGIGTPDFASGKVGEIERITNEITAARRAYDAARTPAERGKHAQKMADLAVKLHAATGALCLHENGTMGQPLDGGGGRRFW